LRILQSFDPSLRLLVAHGRSDLVTPYGVSRYLIDQLPSSGTSERTQFRAYRGGHMFYLDPDSRRAFTNEAAEFYQAAR
jgi:carboxypeptidase C (cathepsin A)